MSGIPKSQRTPTKISHITKGKHLRIKVMEYLEEDFGTDKMYLQNGKKNPRYWLIKKIRDNIYDLTQDIMYCLIAAKAIYMVNIYEYNERRRYFTKAISDCESIIQELNIIVDYLKIKPSKYSKLSDDIEEFIETVKRKRQFDNKIRIKILKQEAIEKLKIEQEIK